MKERKNKKSPDNPLFSNKNRAGSQQSQKKGAAFETIQEYSLLQIIMLKLKSRFSLLGMKVKQNVLSKSQKAYKSAFFWKGIAICMGVVWGVQFSKGLHVEFQAPVVLTKTTVTTKPVVQEMGLGGIFAENPAAPVSYVNLGQKNAEEYIRHYGKVAIAEHHKFHVPASIKMAQALVESRAGTSTLAKNNHNHFGVKCFSKKCKKGHCTNLTDDSHKDFFRNYNSAWESWRAHSLLLNSKKYKSLQKYGNDYKAWAKGLKKLGYATDKNYDKKLIELIEKYKLYRLDSQ